MKKFLKRLAESEFTLPTIGAFFWLVVFIVNGFRAWTDSPLTGESFMRLLTPAVLMIICFLSLGECSKRRETKKIIDRLNVLAKGASSETKKIADLENTDTWMPCIFKPCTGQPGSHQCLDGLYSKSRQLFKLDPALNIDKARLSYIWKEDDVLEFTMK